MGDEDWRTPAVPERLQQLLSSSNWSMEDPSPACSCSRHDNKKMLPDCPAGAGGLPPPEVRPRPGPDPDQERTQTRTGPGPGTDPDQDRTQTRTGPRPGPDPDQDLNYHQASVL
ncbi:Retinal-specific ATP-binding cassette transporter [Liparis tanakae]|uniref:Retinal-specific ATP-binding cassette transporter n=1 Tax=Liparis tanakae TaxID=230148 RepID=A0A4Z2EV68_9TELE|nr:Retinal-specific ATP-binding cassette transporter [Liparis tanakae]